MTEWHTKRLRHQIRDNRTSQKQCAGEQRDRKDCEPFQGSSTQDCPTFSECRGEMEGYYIGAVRLLRVDILNQFRENWHMFSVGCLRLPNNPNFAGRMLSA